jgi:glutamate/tyrosine decarboxylase-like PLP-dependent enzyme
MDSASPARPAVGVDADVLQAAAAAAMEYATSVDDRRVAPGPDALAALASFDEALPEVGTGPLSTLRLLHEVGGPATVATTGSRYFGFVIGAVYPVALGAAWLSSAWDQNGALPVMSPVAAKLHDVTRDWLVDLLRLPPSTAVAFVTGATVANASCLAAGRDALLARLGWDAQGQGLFGAPAFDVVIGERAHSTVSKSLGLVGLGRQRVTVVPADDQGRMRADLLPDLDGPVLVCAQAGDVNTGAFDPFDEIADWLSERSGWLHVDGAFGLWALADPTRAALVAGLDRADSWATDAHKWLNVTYDNGVAFVRRPADLRRTFASVAGYLPADAGFEAMHNTPQSSQRARQIEVWSVLRTLGRQGVADLVTGACDAATAIAARLRDGGPDDPQRRGPEPGAGSAGRRADDRGPHRRDPIGWPHLVRSHPMGRSHGDADQRLVLEDPQRRRHVRRRRDPRLRRPRRPPPALIPRMTNQSGSGIQPILD